MKSIIMQDRQGRDVDVTKAARQWRRVTKDGDKWWQEYQSRRESLGSNHPGTASAESCWIERAIERTAIEETVNNILGPYKRREFVRLAKGEATDG